MALHSLGALTEDSGGLQSPDVMSAVRDLQGTPKWGSVPHRSHTGHTRVFHVMIAMQNLFHLVLGAKLPLRTWESKAVPPSVVWSASYCCFRLAGGSTHRHVPESELRGCKLKHKDQARRKRNRAAVRMNSRRDQE